MNIKTLCPFGASGNRFVKGTVPTARSPTSELCFFIGYGGDSRGFRVVVPKENGYDVFVDDDVKIRCDRVLVRNILTQCRLNPLLVK